MNNKTKQIIVVVSVFVIALASLGTVIGLLVSTGRLSEYSGGFSYTLSGTRATITGYDGDDTDVVVPDKVRGNRVVSIAKDAFSTKAGNIKTITIKTTSTAFSLESEAFKDMTALEEVVLPLGLKEIPAGAFSGCKALRDIVIPDSVTLIGEKAFYNCSSLKFSFSRENYSDEEENTIDKEIFYMPSGLLEIGANAFENCTALIGAHFNKALEKVGDEAFYRATAFTELTFDEDCELASIGNSAFQSTRLRSNANELLEFPHLTTIGDKAFADITTNFTQFKFPATIKSVGANAFMNNTSLATVHFAEGVELETMGEGVFQDCTYLSTIELPESIKEIPAKAFMGCTRLLYNSDFKIGKNVEKIGEGAFAIYTNNATYSRRAITVDNENQNFAILTLQNFSKTNSSSSYEHGLLTNADHTVVYAYFGSYDKTSYFGSKINVGSEEEKADKRFKFYNEGGNQITSINEIKSYAFAGVAFEDMRLPKTVTVLGEYLFYESDDFSTAYIESIKWTWQKTTFNKESDGSPEVEILILVSTEATDSEISDFISSLAADEIYSGRANL
ncbi:MAG: leucine-rich repeat domain-containing protein [Clostridia bacterium]|nr:leucine-rich repeat domain-containing protein [Clostridia bacterium]